MLGLLNNYHFIDGFNQYYFITNTGNIYSYKYHKWQRMSSSSIVNKYKKEQYKRIKTVTTIPVWE